MEKSLHDYLSQQFVMIRNDLGLLSDTQNNRKLNKHFWPRYFFSVVKTIQNKTKIRRNKINFRLRTLF